MVVIDIDVHDVSKTGHGWLVKMDPVLKNK